VRHALRAPVRRDARAPGAAEPAARARALHGRQGPHRLPRRRAAAPPPHAQMPDRRERPSQLPALVHCTAGKDRTGFAAAVVLRTLGVPEETVYEDFMLTNTYTASQIERTLWIIRLVSLFRTDPEKVRPVLGAERAYLEAAFDEIRKDYGSFDEYRRKALGFDDAETAAFRQ